VVETLGQGMEDPHDFQFSPSTGRRLSQVRLLIVSGLGLEPWLPRVRRSWPNLTILQLNSVSTSARLNPHTWLDPVQAEKAVAAISSAFAELDPMHAAEFNDNGVRYITQLKALDARFRARFEPVSGVPFITMHDAWGYLANRYNLRDEGVVELNAEMPPSPRFLATLLHRSRDRGVRILFVDRNQESALARMIGHDLYLELTPLDTLERGEGGVDFYTTGMTRNVDQMVEALSLFRSVQSKTRFP
jgi:ABC-type Zn uptake system ZnuABC Zn-binding protein ZnuA